MAPLLDLGWRRPRPHRRRRSATLALAVVLAGLALAVPTGLAARVARTIGGDRAAAILAGPLPACRADELPAVHQAPADWARTLLDPLFALDRDARPADLAPVAEAGIAGTGSVRLLVIDDLRALDTAAVRAGIRLEVRSAFRSFDDQVRTFDSLERAYGREWTELAAARPGHSEHQLGTALDLDGGDDWLATNAWRFGFVVSYPPGRSPRFTCYQAEPWHVRYVGRAEAGAVHDSGLSLREWLWLHGDEPA